MTLPRQRESGFALLLVFLLAAAITIMLYKAMPRVVFEGERAKEQLLIDRGEQYRRAIQLYSRKFNGQFPARIEQLENTNNMRFLRRRYKDPMTGSDEWRLIHIGPGGIFTDSLTQKPPQQKKPGEGDSAGDNPTDMADQTGQAGEGQAPAPGQRRGASDRGVFTAGQGNQAQPGEEGYYPPAPDNEAVDPTAGAQESDTGETPAEGGEAQPGAPGQPGGQPARPGAAQPGPPFGFQGNPQGQQPGTSTPGQIGVFNPQNRLVNFPSGSNQQSGPGGIANSAIRDIQNRLRQPGGTLMGSSSGLTIGGGGIAGVATKAKGEGIKVYDKQTNYGKWEFIYDPRKDPSTPVGQRALLPPGARGPGIPTQPNPGSAGPTK